MEPLSPCPAAFLASLLLVLLPEARGDCGPPQRAIGTQQKQESQDSYPVGTTLSYTCIPGYEPIPGTRPSIVCNEHSEWSGAPEFCRGKRCPIPNIENGRVVEDSDFRFGAQITFACEVGYRLIGANGARCILRSSSMAWDRTPPHCQRIPCFPPPNIPNGRHDGRDDYVYGTAVTYRCDDPFSLIGNKTLVCLSDQDDNGRWSSDAPRCAVVKCQIPTVPNGIMVTSYRPSYTYQDRVVFRCNDGYHLKENKGDISCGANNTWEPHLPECILGSSGGDEGTTTPPAGPTIRPSVGSTVRPVDETTRTEIGSGIPAAAIAGAVLGVIAVVAIIVAALTYKFYSARGKPSTAAGPTESYNPVPSEADKKLNRKQERKTSRAV